MEKRFVINGRKKFEINHEFKTYSDGTLLSEVEPIKQGMYYPSSESNLETLVEYPLLDAAKDFFKKGIKTHASSANKKDVNDDVYIILYYNSLSDNNKKIAEKLYKVYEQQFHRKEKLVKITVLVNEKTTVGEIKQKFSEIVSMFESQEK